MKKYILLLAINICFIQCSLNKERNNSIEFKTQKDIVFKEINYPDILGISMQLIKIDSLLLINDFHGDTLINIFNINKNIIEKKLIPKGDGPGELTSPLDIQVLENNLYVQCRPKFSLNHINISSILDTNSIIQNDAQLPQKSDRFLPLSDSLFVFSGLWNKRYSLFNLANKRIIEFGDYPNYWSDEKDIPTEAKAMFHQCRLAKHPKKSLFTSCSSHVLEVYSYDHNLSKLPTLIWKKQLGKYSYNFTSGNIITVNEKNGSDPQTLELACSEEYIYIVIQSKEAENKCNIMILDWNGKAVKLLKSDKRIVCLAIDENNKQGYCIIEDPEDKLVFFDLE